MLSSGATSQAQKRASQFSVWSDETESSVGHDISGQQHSSKNTATFRKGKGSNPMSIKAASVACSHNARGTSSSFDRLDFVNTEALKMEKTEFCTTLLANSRDLHKQDNTDFTNNNDPTSPKLVILNPTPKHPKSGFTILDSRQAQRQDVEYNFPEHQHQVRAPLQPADPNSHDVKHPKTGTKIQQKKLQSTATPKLATCSRLKKTLTRTPITLGGISANAIETRIGDLSERLSSLKKELRSVARRSARKKLSPLKSSINSSSTPPSANKRATHSQSIALHGVGHTEAAIAGILRGMAQSSTSPQQKSTTVVLQPKGETQLTDLHAMNTDVAPSTPRTATIQATVGAAVSQSLLESTNQDGNLSVSENEVNHNADTPQQPAVDSEDPRATTTSLLEMREKLREWNQLGLASSTSSGVSLEKPTMQSKKDNIRTTSHNRKRDCVDQRAGSSPQLRTANFSTTGSSFPFDWQAGKLDVTSLQTLQSASEDHTRRLKDAVGAMLMHLSVAGANLNTGNLNSATRQASSLEKSSKTQLAIVPRTMSRAEAFLQHASSVHAALQMALGTSATLLHQIHKCRQAWNLTWLTKNSLNVNITQLATGSVKKINQQRIEVPRTQSSAGRAAIPSMRQWVVCAGCNTMVNPNQEECSKCTTSLSLSSRFA